MAGFITVEVVLLNQEPKGPTGIEILYSTLVFLLFVFCVLLMRNEKVNRVHNSSESS